MKYFNPPWRLKEVARPLNGSFSIEGLLSQLNPEEVLVGCFTAISHQTCPVLENRYQLDQFESGSFDSTFWAVPKESKFIS